MDIDDIHRTDTFGKRLVCVVYVSYNSTHFKNVNKALLAEGFAVIDNYDNEFNPYSWSLYYPKEESPEPFPSTEELYIITIGIAVVVGIIVFALSRKKETFVATKIPS